MENEFLLWMEINLSISENSRLKYARAIRAVSKDMINENVIDKQLYNISSPIEFESLSNVIFNNSYFISKDYRGNRMYSVAMNHYLDFLRDRGL